jgi:tyrosine-protein kinase Etk/Wzc
MAEPGSAPLPEEEMHLVDYLLVLAKYSRMIMVTSLTVTVAAYSFFFLHPNRYTATARLLPPQQNLTLSAQLLESLGGSFTPGTMGSAGSSSAVSGLLGLRSPSDLYVGMIKSDTVCDGIIERFHLCKLYRTRSLEDARKKLRQNARVSTSRKEGLIIIAATDTAPRRAADLANAFGGELDKLLKRLVVQEAQDRLAFLEKERRQASLNLIRAEEALRTFSEQNSVVQIDTQTRGMLEYIARLRAQIDSKEVQKQVLCQQATPLNYDVVRLETELKGLKEKLRAAETQWDQSCVGDVCLPTVKTPGLGLEYLRLFREAKFQEGLYQLFTKMAEIARLDMAKNVAVVQFLDRALPPGRRSNQRLKPALLAGLVTFILMVFAAFGRERWQRARAEKPQSFTQLSHYLAPWVALVNWTWAGIKRRWPRPRGRSSGA